MKLGFYIFAFSAYLFSNLTLDNWICFSINYVVSWLAFTYSKSTIKVPEQCVTYAESLQYRHQYNAIDVVLVSLLTLSKWMPAGHWFNNFLKLIKIIKPVNGVLNRPLNRPSISIGLTKSRAAIDNFCIWNCKKNPKNNGWKTLVYKIHISMSCFIQVIYFIFAISMGSYTGKNNPYISC